MPLWNKIDGDQSLALNLQSGYSNKCFHERFVSLFSALSKVIVENLWILGVYTTTIEQLHSGIYDLRYTGLRYYFDH
jgi:hypothetical protein